MSTTNDAPLGVRFREHRKAMSKTQKQAADATGVSLRTVQNFESGGAVPQPANLRSLLRWANMDGVVPPGTELTERAWPPEVSVFLDVIGAYLVRFDDTERLRIIHSITRQIFDQRHESD